MSKQWRVRCKRPVRGIAADEDPNYPAIGRAIKHLDKLARIQSWQPLSSFLSEDPDAAVDLLDDEEEISAILGRDLRDDEDAAEAIAKKLGKVRWFKPEEALATVQSSAEAIEQLPHRLPLEPQNALRVVKELKELQQVLQLLVKQDVNFRFYAEFG